MNKKQIILELETLNQRLDLSKKLLTEVNYKEEYDYLLKEIDKIQQNIIQLKGGNTK